MGYSLGIGFDLQKSRKSFCTWNITNKVKENFIFTCPKNCKKKTLQTDSTFILLMKLLYYLEKKPVSKKLSFGKQVLLTGIPQHNTRNYRSRVVHIGRKHELFTIYHENLITNLNCSPPQVRCQFWVVLPFFCAH